MFTITSKSGKITREFDEREWMHALVEAATATRGNGQTVEDKAVELLCTARSLRHDRLQRLTAISEPTAQEVARQATVMAFDRHVLAYLREHSRYADTAVRAGTGRIMSEGMAREYAEAQAYARQKVDAGEFPPFTAADTEEAQDARYLCDRLGMFYPKWATK